MNELWRLASTNGVPLSSIGSRPYIPPPQADPNGPMPSIEDIQRYLALTGMVYPQLFEAGYPINREIFSQAVESWPMSRNVEDRRPR